MYNRIHHYPQESATSSSLDFQLGTVEECLAESDIGSQEIFAHNHPFYHQQRRSAPSDEIQEIQWFLFQKSGTISFRLTTEREILVGSSGTCDIVMQTPTVEKRHAVLAFQPISNSFTVRDLNTTNGTYLNKRRISADHPETVSNLDQLRFGYDPTLYEIRSASLNTARIGGTASPSSSGPSSLPNYPSSYNFTSKTGKDASPQHVEQKLWSGVSRNEDNNFAKGLQQLPPKSSISLPKRKSLLTVTKSDPGGGDITREGFNNNNNSSNISGVLFSDRLFQRRNSGEKSGASSYSKSGFHDSPAVFLENHQASGERGSLAQGNMQQQQVGRSGTSGVCSPSLTLDSGRGSSSAPSSPAKEMSPVQMMTGTPTGSSGILTNAAGASSNSSHNASPVFARKLSRPMEYLLGQQSEQQQAEPGFVPDPPSGQSSGNYTSFCSDPLLSFGAGGNYNHHQQLRNSENINNNNHEYSSAGGGGSGDCEILQITEDYEVTDADSGAEVLRKDSLEEKDNRLQNNCGGNSRAVEKNCARVINGDINGDSGTGGRIQPQFIVGGDIMQPDLNVPNEVFGPLSHAEILNKNLSSANSNCSNVANLNSQQSLGKQGNNQDINTTTSTPTHHARARSSSGDGGCGGSNRSTPLSALYGTPHWWRTDSPPPEENCCPPPPVSSTNTSPFKKPFLLNNNSTYIANSIAAAATNRLKGNSSSSSLTDHIKDLSLESTHSHKSHPSPSSPVLGSGGITSDMTEVKKFTPMAFTIDFSDSSETGGGTGTSIGAVEAKKAAIAERLSKFVPRHRRNASLTKSDDVVGAKEGELNSLSSSSSSKHQPKSNSNSLGRTQQHLRQSSATTAVESSSKCSSLPKKFSGGAGLASSKHPSGGSGSTNNNDSGLRSLSPETISSTTSSSSRSRPFADPKSSLSNNPKPSRDKSSSMTRKSKNQQQSRGGTPASRRTPGESARGFREKTPVSSSRAKSVPLNDLSKCTIPSTAAPATLDKEDTVSEAGTYTVEKDAPEVKNARENIEEVFGLNGASANCADELDKENKLSGTENAKSFSAEPGTRDWVREWAELAAQQHQQKQRPELPDSQYFLRETENLVTAIQERVSKHMKSGGGSASLGAPGSDSEEDEPTLSHHTPVKSQTQQSTPTNYNTKRPPSRTSPFHRESSVLSDSGIRRGRPTVGYNSDLTTTEQLLMVNQQSMAVPLNGTRGISPKPQVNSNKFNNVGGGSGSRSGFAGVSAVNNSSSPHFARNDGGRFSLRMPKSRTPPAQMPPPSPRQGSYSGAVSNSESHGLKSLNGHKSESLSSTQSQPGSNRKYTAGGKVLNVGGGGGPKKSSGSRSNSTLTAKEVELANWKRRKNYDPMKAAAEGKKTRKNGGSSGPESGVEETLVLPTIASPKVNRRETMMTKSLSFHQESYSPKAGSEDEDMIYIVDEMDSSHSNSPNHLGMTRSYHEDVMYYGMPNSGPSLRPKNKLEALDNLVIATIHSLSNKVRTSSRRLLEKLQTQHANDENGALLEEMVSQLKELESPSNSVSPNKSPSRELSGTLKNLKRLEQVVLVLDKVLCDDFEADLNG